MEENWKEERFGIWKLRSRKGEGSQERGPEKKKVKEEERRRVTKGEDSLKVKRNRDKRRRKGRTEQETRAETRTPHSDLRDQEGSGQPG